MIDLVKRLSGYRIRIGAKYLVNLQQCRITGYLKSDVLHGGRQVGAVTRNSRDHSRHLRRAVKTNHI